MPPAARHRLPLPWRHLANCLVLLLAVGTAHARLAQETEIAGLERTREGYVRALLEECLEDQAATSLEAVDTARLEQCVTDSELFSSVEVRTGTTLQLRVEERWTLIPVPLFRSQNDSRSYGLFVIESNFLGRGKLLVTGGSVGTLGNSFLLVLKDPGVGFSDWTAQVVGQRLDEDVFQYREDDKVDGYHRVGYYARGEVGYRVHPDLELGWSVAYGALTFDDVEDFDTDPEAFHFWNIGPSLEFDNTAFRFYFRQGHKAQLRASHQFLRSGTGSRVTGCEASYAWQRPLGGRNVLKLEATAVALSSASVRDSFTAGGNGLLRGVERDGLWARYLAGASLDYQIPFWDGGFGTWTAGPFASYARYRPPGADAAWDTSRAAGAALFLYLKQIALPGIGVAAGHNPDFAGTFVEIQVGLQM